MSGTVGTFPLRSRRRLIGLAFGGMRGARRGSGSDIAGSRPYRPGDDPDRIDWAASARLSAARDADEFVVREYFADEAPRVVVVRDRRPELALAAPDLPWLRKEAAIDAAVGVIDRSVAEARGLVGFLEVGAEPRSVRWCAPGTGGRARALVPHALERDAADDPIGSAFDFLVLHRRAVPPASFVFVLSDFLAPPPLAAWEAALDRGWDVVPVVVQDPLWEQSFPAIDGVVVPLAGVDGVRRVRLRRGESAAWRARHERRLSELLGAVRSLGIDPVLLSSAEPDDLVHAFLHWSTERAASWGQVA